MFAGVFALLLAACGGFLYQRLGSDLFVSIDQGLRSRATELVVVASGGAPGLGRARPAGHLIDPNESFAQIIDPSGQVLDATARLAHRRLLTPEQIQEAGHRAFMFERKVPGYDGTIRLLVTPLSVADRPAVGIVGVSLGDRGDALSSLRTQLLIAGPFALLLACLAAYALAAAALRPVEAMRRRAAAVTDAGRGERLPVPPARDELSRLGETLNEMIGRLEAAVERERRFAADASHELRTPLTLLKTEIELALDGERPRDELVSALASAGEETERLIRLANDLLVLARTQERNLPVRAQPIAVTALLERVAARFSSRLAEAGREVRVEPGPDHTLVADPSWLEQALGNLLDNAIAHGAGTVRIDVRVRGDLLELHVSDEGEGVAPDELSRVFERFRRGRAARATGTGSGLGLAVVAAIAEAHGGEARAEQSAGGFDVWLALPVAADREGATAPAG